MNRKGGWKEDRKAGREGESKRKRERDLGKVNRNWKYMYRSGRGRQKVEMVMRGKVEL